MTHNKLKAKRISQILFALLIGMQLVACSGDSVSDPNNDIDQVFWKLDLDQTVAMMAVGQVLQVKATPLNVHGDEITNLPRPTYRSSDTASLVVDSNGLVRAKGTGFSVMIIAELTSPVNYVTNVDTLFVNVTNDSVALGEFTIQPLDSNIVAAGWWKDMMVRMSDEDGGYVPDALVRYYSSDITIAGIDNTWGSLQPRKPGRVMIYVESNVYGAEYKDSTEIIVTYPIEASISIQNSDELIPSSPPTLGMPLIHLMKGGVVYWGNSSSHIIDIKYDNPADVEGGNLDSIPPNGDGMSTFPTPGTYNYRSVRWGFTGRIIVHP